MTTVTLSFSTAWKHYFVNFWFSRQRRKSFHPVMKEFIPSWKNSSRRERIHPVMKYLSTAVDEISKSDIKVSNTDVEVSNTAVEVLNTDVEVSNTAIEVSNTKNISSRHERIHPFMKEFIPSWNNSSRREIIKYRCWRVQRIDCDGIKTVLNAHPDVKVSYTVVKEFHTDVEFQIPPLKF